ncbi:hypothetical protein FKM82_025843 [Ascaphus truei]
MYLFSSAKSSSALLAPWHHVVRAEAHGTRSPCSEPSLTLFNPNKTVVKMFLVTYDFKDMPPNHVTFLRHRIFLTPVPEEQQEQQEEEGEQAQSSTGPQVTIAKRILCYLMHLRFQRSKSGKIYLHNDIRLLFSRKSIEVDTGIPYELKSFTETPRNPKYSPRV